MAKPCTPHPIAQRVQFFELPACNVNFLWEGVREGYLFSKKRYPSLIRAPYANREQKSPPATQADLSYLLLEKAAIS